MRMVAFMTRPIPTNHRLPVFLPEQKAKVRGDCIKGTHATGSLEQRMRGERQCFQACKHNLLMQESSAMPGKRHGGLAPEGTLRGKTSASAPSCSLDVASTGPRTAREIAAIVGDSTRNIELWLKAAKEGQGGVELARLVSVLMGNGE